jgi:hypothetical protein
MKIAIAPFLLLMSACAIRASHVEALAPDAAPAEGPNGACTWVVVGEVRTTKFFGLTLAVRSRQFEESLFLCCPGGREPDPVCYQSDWRRRQDFK